MNTQYEHFKNFFIGNTENMGKQYLYKGKATWCSGPLERVLRFEHIETMDQAIQCHLAKQITIGSYPYYKPNGAWYCRYVMVDIDDHDSKNIEQIKQNCLTKSKTVMYDLIEHYSIQQNCILRDFSGRGVHIWIKLLENTPLSRAWDFKMNIEKRLLEIHGINEEVFPKQNELTLDKFGNCCKLPLSINRHNGEFCEILDDFDLSQQGLGFKIPEWIPKNTPLKPIVKASNELVNKVQQRVKIEQQDQCFEWFLNHIKPCLKRIALDGSLTHGIGNKNGHFMNLSLCDALIYLGASNSIIQKAFRTHPNYDPTYTEKMINGARKNFKVNHAYIKCETIEKRGYCIQCYKEVVK